MLKNCIATLMIFLAANTFAADVRTLFQNGRKAIDEEKYEAAVACFQEILNKDPRYEPMWTQNNLGYSLCKLKRYDEAIACFNKAFSLPTNKQDRKLYINAAVAELARGENDKVIEVCRRGVELYKDEPWLWDNMGWAYSLKGQKDKSEEAYEAAAKIAFKASQPTHSTTLSLPFKGRWSVEQGNLGKFSHRSLTARFAWDFQAVDDAGNVRKPDANAATDYVGFGTEVLAAADGKVVAASDGVADNKPGETNPLQAKGNYVIIEHTPNEFTVYYHMKQGSVAVKTGQKVSRGDVIGKCGNSGFSTQPHLHFSLMNSAGSSAMAQPARFKSCLKLTDGHSEKMSDYTPQQKDIIANE